jgi:WD40 repeat protein
VHSPSNLNAIAWGGEHIVAAGDDGVIRDWDLSQEKLSPPRELIGHRGVITSLAANPATPAQFASGGADGTVRLWNVNDGQELRSVQHGAPVLAVAFAPDGKTFLSSGGGKAPTIWSAADGKRIVEMKQAGRPVRSVRAAAFAYDGSRIVIAYHGGLGLFDTGTGTPLDQISRDETAFDSIVFCGQTRIVAGRFGSAGQLWDTGGQWTLDRTIGGESQASPFTDRVTALDFSPDGRLLAAGGGQPSRQGEIVLLNPADGAIVRRLDDIHSDTVFCVRFSPNGRQIASGAADKFVRITDVATGKITRALEGHTSHVLGVAWSHDGRIIASAGADNTLRFWDIAGTASPVVVSDFEKELTSVNFLGRNPIVVTTGGEPRLRVTDLSGRNVRTLEGSNDFIYAARPSADGALIVAGGQDGILRIWDANTARPVASVP